MSNAIKCVGEEVRKLPVLGDHQVPQTRPSSAGKWRAATLALVHVVIAVHIVHFLVAARTLSPLEPSEAMYTLETGSINAGFLAFVLMLASTAIFGRFFCGWGCHLVAIQDLVLVGLRRIGVRPRRFRARLLVWGPTIVAGYMFVWPVALRLIRGRSVLPDAGFHIALWTDSFWATFPGVLMAIATFLVCGAVAVYVMGPKGFCRFGCPYGALFGPLDRLSLLRVVVSDACHQCGHCTAVCTSGVRVHEEVRDFGMVVDSNCMKCTDCVSVCPNQALRLAWSAPVKSKRRGARPAKTYDCTLPEELAAAAIWVFTTLALRGLYDGPPLLLSVAIGALTAVLTVRARRAWSRRKAVPSGPVTSSLPRRAERHAISIWPLGIWFLFVCHSAFVQWERHSARRFLDRTEIRWDDLRSTRGELPKPGASHASNLARARQAFEAADRWGLLGVVEIKLGLAWCSLLDGDMARAETHLKAARSLRPDLPALHDRLIEFYDWRGDLEGTRSVLLEKTGRFPQFDRDWFRLGLLLKESNDVQGAVDKFRHCLHLNSKNVPALFELGVILRRSGQLDEALVCLKSAWSLESWRFPVCRELAEGLLEKGQTDEALIVLQQARGQFTDDSEQGREIDAIVSKIRLESAVGPGESSAK